MYDPDLYYAAESRNYPSDPDTLFVTCRDGGVKVFDISDGQFSTLARWNSTAPVEGQDRLGDWLVVSELGIGPNGQFLTSTGPKLHLFNVSSVRDNLTPFASVELSQYIDAILHVKFVQMKKEVWAVCTGGFATSTVGAIVLVNLTSVLMGEEGGETASIEVNILATEVLQPEGVMISPTNSCFVYIGGIQSTLLAVIDISSFWNPVVVETRVDVGAQLVGATWLDQPHSATAVDKSLVFMACWGVNGGLVVLDTKETPAHPPQVAQSFSYRTSQANRVKLDPTGQFAIVPLEQELGGVAVYNIQAVSDGEVSLNTTVHVPLSEFRNGPDGALVQSTKTYCLAISRSNKVLVFIAETASIYIYDIHF